MVQTQPPSLCSLQIKNIADMDDSEIKRVWNEIKASGSLNFKYREQATAYELAPFIAGNMLNYPSNHIISAGYMLDDLDISLFRQYVSKLVPESAVTVLRSRTYSWLADDTPNDATPPVPDTPLWEGANRKEPWYGVSYHSDSPSSDLLSTWKSHREGSGEKSESFSLSLPGPNPFICYELADVVLTAPIAHTASSVAADGSPQKGEAPVRTLRSARPVAISNLAAGLSPTSSIAGDIIWHSRDVVFNQPRSIFQCLLHTANCGKYGCR
jgi:secreted Zn-dependent insulinase-like peptidase